MVILDTNIIIDHLRQRGNNTTILTHAVAEHFHNNIGISIITIQELYAGKSIEDGTNERELTNLLVPFVIFPYTKEVAKIAGSFIRRYGISFADAAIASTAILHDAELCTLNTKDFRSISEIQLYKIPNH